MRRFACLAGVLRVAILAMGITREQSLVSSVLQTLKFEPVKAKSGLIGGPQSMKITPETLKHLEKLMKDGGSLVIEPTGEVKLLDAKGQVISAKGK